MGYSRARTRPLGAGGTIPDAHRAGAVFLTSAAGLLHWYLQAEIDMVHASADPLGQGRTPVVLRIPKPPGCNVDSIGTREAGARAYRCTTGVDADKIEVFDGERWHALGADIDATAIARIAYEDDGYFSSDYPLVPRGADVSRTATRNPTMQDVRCEVLRW